MSVVRLFPIKQSAGFGLGRPGEHYYSQGFSRSQYGLMPTWSMVKQKDTDDSGFTNLGKINFFAQAGTKSYLVGTNGRIFGEVTPGIYDYSEDRNPGSSSGNGLIGDQKGRLLYARNQYLGMYNGAWNDTWKDFGVSSTEFRPLERYEDRVYAGNVNNVALLAADDSFNTAAFSLPSGFLVRLLKSGRSNLLIGANIDYQGVLVLWDGQATRSIAPWLWTERRVLAVASYKGWWLVLTENELLLTNGYTSERISGFVDDPLGLAGFDVAPQGLLVQNDKAFILHKTSRYNRQKPGLYVFDLKSLTWDFAPISTLNTFNAEPTAIFADKGNATRILTGYTDNNLVKNYIGNLSTEGAATSQVIFDGPASPTDKVAQAVILNVGISTRREAQLAPTFDVSVKICDMQRQVWGYHQTNATASAANKLRVDGSVASFFNAQVGDEVTILQGSDAGKVRHITAIANDGASNEEWTLDSALSTTLASGVNLNVQPFKLIAKKSFSSLAELKNTYFECKNRIVGKRFLIKVLFENMNIQPELMESHLLYTDLGYKS